MNLTGPCINLACSVGRRLECDADHKRLWISQDGSGAVMPLIGGCQQCLGLARNKLHVPFESEDFSGVVVSNAQTEREVKRLGLTTDH